MSLEYKNAKQSTHQSLGESVQRTTHVPLVQEVSGSNPDSPFVMSIPFAHPFTAIVSGPTGCGKTQWTLRLIKHAETMISPPPQKIVWCFGIYQKVFDDVTGVEFHEGIPNLDAFDGRQRTLLILDDLMQETDSRVTNIFTKISHHKNVSVVYLTQNLFYGSKQNRTISLNSQYFVLYKNARDANQVAYLARQMYPGKSAFMVEAFKDATKQPYSYLLVDLKSDNEEELRLRTNVFPDETTYVYVAK